MQTTPEYVEKLVRSFYSAGFSYAFNPESGRVDPEVVAVSKETLKLIRAGRLEEAATVAGKTDGSLSIFEQALKAADSR